MIDSWLTSVPPAAVYVLVVLLVGVESVGVPVPGETALITGALLSAHPHAPVSPYGVAAAGIAGAVGGDSIGYAVGRRFGPALFGFLGRRFPRHWSADHLDYSRHLFGRYGMGAVCVARFVALLRMTAGPLAGSLDMHYPRFLVANASGAIVWAAGMTLLVHQLGSAAQRWVSWGAWALLGVALLLGLVVGRGVQRAFERGSREYAARPRAGLGGAPT